MLPVFYCRLPWGRGGGEVVLHMLKGNGAAGKTTMGSGVARAMVQLGPNVEVQIPQQLAPGLINVSINREVGYYCWFDDGRGVYFQ